MPIIQSVGPVHIIGSPDYGSRYQVGLTLDLLRLVVEMVRNEAPATETELGTDSGALEIYDPVRGTWERMR